MGSILMMQKSHPLNTDQEEDVIRWEEGCMDDEETRVKHLIKSAKAVLLFELRY